MSTSTRDAYAMRQYRIERDSGMPRDYAREIATSRSYFLSLAMRKIDRNAS